MLFGLSDTSSTFMHPIIDILHPDLNIFAVVYFDVIMREIEGKEQGQTAWVSWEGKHKSMALWDEKKAKRWECGKKVGWEWEERGFDRGTQSGSTIGNGTRTS